MTHQAEKNLVEDYMIKHLIGKGWTYIEGNKLDRKSNEEPLILSNLISAIKKINSNLKLSDSDIDEVLKQLRLQGIGVEGSKKILNAFKHGVWIKLEKSKDLVMVKLFDYDNLENNEFIVSNQVIFESTKEEIRPDIILYVNGIPLTIIECKDLTSSSLSWVDAFNQIMKRYRNKVREPFKYLQIGIAAEQKAKYFPIVSWSDEVRIYEWRKDETQEPGKDVSMTSIFEMLTPKNLLELIKDFIFVREERGSPTKVITRYMQYRAVNKITNRVKANIQNKDSKNRGLVWHWQGSGKTLTMAFAAHKLYYMKELENPTIFFIVDRQDLEEQIYQEVNALDMPKVEAVTSIHELKKILEHDNGKGKRGLFTILIHKFRPGDFDEFRKEIEKLSKNQQTFLTRKNIIAFIDESHRTQYGLLAAQMKNILQNAFFFAFTGTPVAKKEQNTYSEFGYPSDDELYLDKYFIKDAIRDGFTLKIVYQPRLEKEVHLKKEQLDLLLTIEDEDLPEKKRKEYEEKVKKKINIRKAYYKNKDRIAKIAKDISQHFKENLDNKYKAMVVAVDREACVFYKRELDKFLPPEYSEIVMTYTKDDPLSIRTHMQNLQERYPGKDISDINKEVTGQFKEEDTPKILIVTDMLLTGFDAPMLQTMYLDKPLKEHRLLQAIARTNRPFKDVKETGLIIDYLGIIKEFKKAFEMYAKEDIEGAIYDIEQIKKEFKDTLKETLALFEDFTINKVLNSRTYLFDVIRFLVDNPKKAKKFIDNYKTLIKKYEALGSDETRLEYKNEMVWLTYIYNTYMAEIEQKEEFQDEKNLNKYFSRTIKLIHKSTEIQDLKQDLPIIEFNENYIEQLEEKYKTKEEKAANIVFTLNRYVLVDRDKAKVDETIIERVERLFDAWKKQTKTFSEIYQEGIKIIQQRNKLLERQKELELSNFEFITLLTLEKRIKNTDLVEGVRKFSQEIQNSGILFSNWTGQPSAKKEIQKMVRRFVLGYVKKKEIDLEDVDEISSKIFEDLKKYEKRI